MRIPPFLLFPSTSYPASLLSPTLFFSFLCQSHSSSSFPCLSFALLFCPSSSKTFNVASLFLVFSSYFYGLLFKNSGEVWSNTKVGNKQCLSDARTISASMDWSAFESGQAETPLAWPSCAFVSVYKCLKIILLGISLNSSAKRIAMILASMFSLTLYYPNM